MSLNRDGLQRVLDAFEQGKWDEIHLETHDTVLRLSSQELNVGSPETSHVWAQSGAREGEGVTSRPGPAGTTESPETPATEVDQPALSTAGAYNQTVPVVAPSPGIFWRSPSPGAPPFAEVGDRVEPDAVLCIVEIMKLMNTVGAPHAGVIVEVVPANGQQVESGDVLFRLHVDAS
jgi:acetyl-CoA carboxylase biotin carboxyl carrier protein